MDEIVNRLLERRVIIYVYAEEKMYLLDQDGETLDYVICNKHHNKITVDKAVALARDYGYYVASIDNLHRDRQIYHVVTRAEE